MKKYIMFLASALILVLLQACMTDTKKTEINEPIMSMSDRHEMVQNDRTRMMEQRETELSALIVNTRFYEDSKGRQVYYKAQVDPAYVGGEEAMNKFLKANLEFPPVAEKEENEGTVFIDFIVAENGEVNEVKVSSHTYAKIDPLFTKEALRVVNMMPDWTPGSQEGKAVDVKFSIPITFLIR